MAAEDTRNDMLRMVCAQGKRNAPSPDRKTLEAHAAAEKDGRLAHTRKRPGTLGFPALDTEKILGADSQTLPCGAHTLVPLPQRAQAARWVPCGGGAKEKGLTESVP